MIILHVHFQILPEKEEAFLLQMQPLMAASRKEEGNHRYELMKSLEQDFAYTMIEVWEGEEAIQAHNDSEHFKLFVENVPAYLAARIQVESYSGSVIEE